MTPREDPNINAWMMTERERVLYAEGRRDAFMQRDKAHQDGECPTYDMGWIQGITERLTHGST